MYGQNNVLEARLREVTVTIEMLDKIVKRGGIHALCIYDILYPLKELREELLRDLRITRDINKGGQDVRPL